MSVGTFGCACLLAVAALVAPAAAQETRTSGAAASTSSRLLDVPFVPQTEALCGGAAVAMVFRYWGTDRVYAEDFASLVDDSAEGITLNRLSQAITDRGWRAIPFGGSAADISSHLATGRPIVALIEDRPGRHHYVVVVAWTGEKVVLHDPAHGPFRVIDRKQFDRAWSATNHTAVLVLPPIDRGDSPPSGGPSKGDSPASDRCSGPLAEAVRLAREGDLADAEALLALAGGNCPDLVDARRELAGIRFLQERWADAADLAGEVVARDPSDLHAWQLLASSRFLQGDTTGALRAWNRRAEPRVDLARIEGLDRMRHDVVADLLNLHPDDVLTDRSLARARRRVEGLPAIQASRVSYTPGADGRAMIDVAVLEKPVVPRTWPSLASMGVHAAIAREARLETANLVGSGELWTASWRWWAGRPRVSVGLTAPRLLGATGLWAIHGSWEQQSYWRQPAAIAPAATPPSITSERRQAHLSFGDWTSGDVRWQVIGGLDRWTDRGSHASAGGAIERRWMGDRVAARAEATMWRTIGRRGDAFGSSAVSAAWRSTAGPGHTWAAQAGVHHASARAPLDLWPAADTGQVRPMLLRAHPLLHDGAIRAADLSRVLMHATIERQQPLMMTVPARVWWATFVDVARRGSSPHDVSPGAHIDAGVGLRISVPGAPHVLRVDIARGLRDGRMALSAAWQSAWTRW